MIAAALLLLTQDPTSMTPCGESYGQRLASRTFEIPGIGAEHTAEIGESIVAVARVDTHEDGLEILTPVSISGRYMWSDFAVTLPVGADLEPVGNGAGRAYKVGNPEYYLNGRRRGGIMVPVVALAMDSGDVSKSEIAVNWGFSSQVHDVDLSVQRISRCDRLGEDSFRRELVYTGVSRGAVTFEYREFLNNLARPAFSQTVTYDLAEGATVGFRGARFEVLEANNVEVRYRVIRHLDQ